MNKLTMILSAGVATLFFTACGGINANDDDTERLSSEGLQIPGQITQLPIAVNAIGTWNYQIWTFNTPCDGLLAQGTKVVDSMNGDITKMGNTLTQGTTFASTSNLQCSLISIDEIGINTFGLPSTMINMDASYGAAAGVNTLLFIDVDSFNTFQVEKEYYFTNGVVITELLTRI